MNNNYVKYLLSMSRVLNNSKAKEYSKKKMQRVAFHKSAHAESALYCHIVFATRQSVCGSVAIVLCVHQALYHLATREMGIATDDICLSLGSQFSLESARKLTTRLPTPCFPLVMSPFVSLQNQIFLTFLFITGYCAYIQGERIERFQSEHMTFN